MPVKYIDPATIEEFADNIRRENPVAVIKDGAMELVDIYKLAEALGCKVEEVDFDPPQVSARVIRNKATDSSYAYTIQVSRRDSTRRKKFSVAHEISHIVLHDDGKSNFVELRQPSGSYDARNLFKETQANMLAAALLLPADQVRKAWYEVKSVDQVADIFSVTTTAAYNRLDNLGLLLDD